MKKIGLKQIVVVLMFLFSGVGYSNAQELGMRFGDVSAGNVAIDAVFSTGKYNRLHGNLSFGNGVAADLLWDFFYRPIIDDGLDWYMGVGPYLGLIQKSRLQGDETDFNLGAAFEIGIEYHFYEIPVAIGLDYRPTFEIIDYTDIHWDGFGLNLRYVF